MKARTTAICTTVLLLGFSVPAWGVPITLAFSGKVTEVYDNGGYLDGSIQVGTPFWGAYTFESEVVDRDEDLRKGEYPSPGDPGLTMSVHIGTYAISAPLGSITVENDTKDLYRAATPTFDLFGIGAGMGIQLVDLSAVMLGNDILPLTPPSLSGLPSYLRTFSLGTSGYFGAGGSLETLVVIPEPAMFVVGLLAMASLSLKRRQR